MEDLVSIRKELDAIDAQIIELLIRRDKLIEAVADYKSVNNLPIRDHQREAELLSEKRMLAAGKLPEGLVSELFETIIKYSCLKQEQVLKRKI